MFELKKQNFKWYIDKIGGWNDEEQMRRLQLDLEEQLKENYKKRIRTILQVFKDNTAKKLCEKLGFRVYGETETHYQMEKA